MTGRTNQRRWKNFLIRRDVQLPIIMANMAFLAIVFATLVVALLSPLYHDMLHADGLWIQNVSGHLFLILLRRIAIAMLLILVAASIHQLVLSHRFCGPLVNFGHTFERMARRDFSRKVYLRRWDFLKAEAGQVNAIIDRLNNDAGRLDEYLARIDHMLTQMATTARTRSVGDSIDDLRRWVDACRNIVETRHGAPAAEAPSPVRNLSETQAVERRQPTL